MMTFLRILFVFSSVFYIEALLSQTQFGIKFAYGPGGMFTKKTSIESPPHTFRHHPYFFNPQFHVDLSLRDEVNQISVSFQSNNFSMAAWDRSKNILFFPELNNSRGTGIIAGGSARTISIWYGRIISKKNWSFTLSAGVFTSKYDDEFQPVWGFSTNELDSNMTLLWEWKFVPKSNAAYSKNLLSYGVGIKPELAYNFKNGFSLNGIVEFNKGLVKVLEQSYQTDFYSSIEPEKNATYVNTIKSYGSNLQILLGVSYSFSIRSQGSK